MSFSETPLENTPPFRFSLHILHRFILTIVSMPFLSGRYISGTLLVKFFTL